MNYNFNLPFFVTLILLILVSTTIAHNFILCGLFPGADRAEVAFDRREAARTAAWEMNKNQYLGVGHTVEVLTNPNQTGL